MNEYIDRVTQPGVSISRNVLDEEDEEYYREEELKKKGEDSLKFTAREGLTNGLLVVAVGSAAASFTKCAFASLHSDESCIAGKLSLGKTILGKLYTDESGFLILEIPCKAEDLEKHIGYAADVALTVLDYLKPEKVFILDTFFASRYVTNRDAEPPLLRILTSRKANVPSVQFCHLEVGNLIRGYGAAFLAQCEMEHIWAVLVVSLQNVRWYGDTVAAFLPVLNLLKQHGLLDTNIEESPEVVRRKCLECQEAVDATTAMLHM